MVEKPPLDRYHTYREVEAPGGPGGEWRHFYQPHSCNYIYMYIFSTYDAYVVEMSRRSKKVGYIRMFNDRTQFESLMFYVFLILYLLFLY